MVATTRPEPEGVRACSKEEGAELGPVASRAVRAV
jgi:hypothetical protein